MCYDVAYMTKNKANYAKRFGATVEEVASLEQSIEVNKAAFSPTYHTNGFAHHQLPVITHDAPYEMQAFEWGLIPFWVKDAPAATKLANMCLNARGESIFEKPSFRNAAKQQRCLIIIDGGFEHHHQDGKTYPFHFKLKDEEPFALAGLWESWEHQGIIKHSCSIVTTAGNELMAKIHNNPKTSGPRMPVILPKELERDWLNPIHDKADIALIQELIQPYDESEMIAYPVAKLRGKGAVGNTEEALKAHNYDQLKLSF
ncbi:MAG: putative SOS response-associated peptidase YedK [Marivirga sp.]|jgi:putative SOS response-associated peptidase YedK